MIPSAQEAADRWAANVAGVDRPMSEAHLERLLESNVRWYVAGELSLEELEQAQERVMRAYYRSRVA